MHFILCARILVKLGKARNKKRGPWGEGEKEGGGGKGRLLFIFYFYNGYFIFIMAISGCDFHTSTGQCLLILCKNGGWYWFGTAEKEVGPHNK